MPLAAAHSGHAYYDELKTLISGHLEDLKENRLPAIQRKTGYSIERIQETWAELAEAESQTGSIYQRDICPHGDPRRVLGRRRGRKVPVRLEDGRTPRLRISNYYRNG